MKHYFFLIPIIVMLSLLNGSEILAEEKAKIVINIPATTLYLYQGDKLIKEYRITVGRIDTPTQMDDSFWVDAIKEAEEKGIYRFTIFSGLPR